MGVFGVFAASYFVVLRVGGVFGVVLRIGGVIGVFAVSYFVVLRIGGVFAAFYFVVLRVGGVLLLVDRMQHLQAMVPPEVREDFQGEGKER